MNTPVVTAFSSWLTFLQTEAKALGFSHIGVSDVNLSEAEPRLQAWLDAGYHGDMHYMAKHGLKRARPQEVSVGSIRVITARMDYLPSTWPENWRERYWKRLTQPDQAVVASYALGRDYHKVLRHRLAQLAVRLHEQVKTMNYRVMVDSAPILEVELAVRAGLGWRGKNTLNLHRDRGSFFFLGEILTDLPLPVTPSVSEHCGQCQACLDICPTQAFVQPYVLDARRCISYLTIEHSGLIPVELRPLMGQRIYGCDDCQVVCPWNKYAKRSVLKDFEVRHRLDQEGVLALWGWSQEDFETRFAGMPIRRIGYQRWRRNLAVALGNVLAMAIDERLRRAIVAALYDALKEEIDDQEQVKAHIEWALEQKGIL